jgi:hypothetical protein
MKIIKATKGFEVLVDDVDFDSLSKHRWCITAAKCRAYAYRRVAKNKLSYMHREIMSAPEGCDVDHINHPKGFVIDNRKGNLRVCSRSQNNANQRKTRGTPRFKGVCFDAQTGKWRAQITCDGKHHNLGRFDLETGAADCYNSAASEFFGVFSRPSIL